MGMLEDRLRRESLGPYSIEPPQLYGAVWTMGNHEGLE